MSKLTVNAEPTTKPKSQTIKKQYIKEPAFLGGWESRSTVIESHPEFIYTVPYCKQNHITTFLSNEQARARLIETGVANPEQYFPTTRGQLASTEGQVNNVKLVQIRYRKHVQDSFKPIVDLYFYAEFNGTETEIYGLQKHFVLVVSRWRTENGVRLFALTKFNLHRPGDILVNQVYDQTTQAYYPVDRYVFDTVKFKWKQYNEAVLDDDDTEYIPYDY